MSKEVKVGIGLIMMLAITVGVLLSERLNRSGGAPTADIPGSATAAPIAQVSTWIAPEQGEVLGPAADAAPPTAAPGTQAAQPPVASRRHSFMPKIPSVPATPEHASQAAPAKAEAATVGEVAGTPVVQQVQANGTDARYQQPAGTPQAAPAQLDSKLLEPQSAPLPVQADAERYRQQAGQWQSPTAPAPRPLPMPPVTAQQEPTPPQYAPQQNSVYAPRPTSYSQQAPYAQAAPAYGASQATNAGTGGVRRNNQDDYQVQPNDNMWKISQRIYGTGAYFKALARYNARNLPAADELKIGDVVKTPTVEELVAKYPELCPKQRRGGVGSRFSTVSAPHRGQTRDYEVREEDTLFDIARFELGEASRWVEIYELNKSALTEDINYLPPGTVLKLPVRAAATEAQPADVLTRNPDGTTTQR